MWTLEWKESVKSEWYEVNSIEEQRKTPKSIPIELWTCIFHMHPHSIGETCIFIGEKLILEKSRSRHLFYFYFKGKENKKQKP